MTSARLACQVDGAADAPPVVLLHGLAMCRDLWLPQLPALASEFLVIRIDLPGHGHSPLLPSATTLADYAFEVKQVLDDLDIRRTAVVGLSLGGMVAQAFALAFPERINALVLAHTSARTDDKVRAIWSDRLDQFEKHGLAAQVEPILGRWFPEGFAKTAPLTTQWIASQILATRPEAYSAAIRVIQQLDHLEALNTIEVPTLVIAGEVDMAAPPAVAALMAARIAGAEQVVMPGVAHLGNVQNPVLFTETVGGFLRGATVA